MAGNTAALGLANPSTTLIVNGYSSGGSSASGLSAGSGNQAREVLSGALTAATLATVLTVSGAGRVPYLAAYAKDTTSRTVRLVVEVDGVTVFDATSSAVTSAGSGIPAIGSGTPAQLFYNSSLVVKVASSLTETDKVAIAYSLLGTS